MIPFCLYMYLYFHIINETECQCQGRQKIKCQIFVTEQKYTNFEICIPLPKNMMSCDACNQICTLSVATSNSVPCSLLCLQYAELIQNSRNYSTVNAFRLHIYSNTKKKNNLRSSYYTIHTNYIQILMSSFLFRVDLDMTCGSGKGGVGSSGYSVITFLCNTQYTFQTPMSTNPMHHHHYGFIRRRVNINFS